MGARDRLEEARGQAAQVLRLDPRVSVARLTYRKPDRAHRSLDALRAGGLPE